MSGPTSRFVHTGFERDPATGALTPAIYRAVSFHHQDPEQHLRWDYSRSGNPTRDALEGAIAELEGGVRGFAFASGNQAITAAFLLFASGDHLIVTRDCQGGTQRLVRAVLSRFGLEVSYVDTDDLDAVRAAIRPETKALLVENFSNPFLRVSDIPALAELAHGRGLKLIVDNTFLTPYLQAPLGLGADLVLHSATKMIAGHGDVTAGLAATADEELGRALYTVQNATGGMLSPDDSYQVLRGLHTLPIRMERAQATAQGLAEWLMGRPEVTLVHYPGLSEDAGRATALRTVRGFSNMVTVRLEDQRLVAPMARHLSMIRVGAGFGGPETTISLPELHCHAALTAPERKERRLTGEILRFSVGLEDLADIEADLCQALAGAASEIQ
jgi:cystathionine beta-lyase/cystathionine gamma-synthase